MPHQWSTWLSLILWEAACAWAWWRGRSRPPVLREASLGVAVNALLFAFFQDRSAWLDPQNRFLVFDLLLLCVFLLLLTRARPPWLMTATALQLLSTLTHVVTKLDPHIQARAYLSVMWMFSYAVLGSLLIGAVVTRPVRRAA